MSEQLVVQRKVVQIREERENTRTVHPRCAAVGGTMSSER